MPPLLALVWGITYSTFGTASGQEELGIVSWTGMTLLIALIGVILWLMASGRLPAYIIEDADDSDAP